MDTLDEFGNIGKRLTALLTNAGYTKKRATEELGLSINSLKKYDKGGVPKVGTLYDLSRLVRVTMEYLLIGEEKTKDLRDEETQLIETFRTLNEKQQEKAIYYLAGITNAVDSFENRLKLLLDCAGYTPKQATDELKLYENAVSKFVNGRVPETKIFYQLSKFFEVSMEWLLKGEVNIKGFSEEENQFIQRYRTLKLKEKRKVIGYIDGIANVEG